ncbi:MAG: hypothetical protein ACTS2F_00530 [Thainema sp.]
MSQTRPLTGTDLVDCAKANAAQGTDVAASRCGYDDIDSFMSALRQAAGEMGVELTNLNDLVSDGGTIQRGGVEISPDGPGQL